MQLEEQRYFWGLAYPSENCTDCMLKKFQQNKYVHRNIYIGYLLNTVFQNLNVLLKVPHINSLFRF